MNEVSTLNQTPRSDRLHIGVYGRRNAGKSSLINAICRHDVALVSNVAGTTTDPVYKSIELHGLGPCVLIDTPGFDDEGALGELRVSRTKEAVEQTDLAILVFSAEYDPADPLEQEAQWIDLLKSKNTPVLAVLNKCDIVQDPSALSAKIRERFQLDPLLLSANDPSAQGLVHTALLRLLPENASTPSIAGHLIRPGDVVLLVMPQDIQAPKGRLILPQVQTIRDLLDHHAIVLSVTASELENALKTLKEPPALIITDSQVFPLVYEKKPPESKLTSFSILLAGVKGDIHRLVKGAEGVDRLTESSRVLIAEACTHAPLTEDIGREKIPALLRKKFGSGLHIDIVSGMDFPEDLTPYDLIVHCGGCMFNRKYLLSRIENAETAGVPMTNYGVLLAKLNGILDKIDF
ncbi:MAG: [FeFe] hydrogenase H-cluster maturation GTPase HydF [Anaerovoracaceae bacterium]|nr:[FeFe] hydrogenase H-cluster maturation GTPase HydF [Anaerovoracaceae bacterium]